MTSSRQRRAYFFNAFHNQLICVFQGIFIYFFEKIMFCILCSCKKCTEEKRLHQNMENSFIYVLINWPNRHFCCMYVFIDTLRHVINKRHKSFIYKIFSQQKNKNINKKIETTEIFSIKSHWRIKNNKKKKKIKILRIG